MSLRTVRMIGTAYSETGDVTLSVLVNGQETHGLTVPTHAGEMPAYDPDNPAPLEVLMTFGVDHTEFAAGSLPVEIRPTGGDIIFAYFDMNYLRPEISGPNTSYTIINPPADTYRDVNSNSLTTDGKENVMVDGVAQTREATAELVGDWHYTVKDGEVMTLDYIVDDVPYIQMFEFTGDGLTTTFTVSGPFDGIYKVGIDGDFTASPKAERTYDLPGKTITFATAPADGAVIHVFTTADSTTP